MINTVMSARAAIGEKIDDLPVGGHINPNQGSYMALPSLDAISSSLNGTLGQMFLLGLGILMVVCFFKKEWGYMIALSLGAIPLAYILWVPDGAKTFFTDIAKKIFG